MSAPSQLSIGDLCRSNEENESRAEDGRNEDRALTSSRHGHSRTNSGKKKRQTVENGGVYERQAVGDNIVRSF
jgi:hypothetical protein